MPPALPRALSLLPVLAAVAAAQGAPDPTAARPERPTVATHAFAVARGFVEVEAGLVHHREPGATTRALLVATKIGVAPRLQLTISTPVTRDAGGVLAADPIFAGLKWQLSAPRAAYRGLALLPGITLPNGPRGDRRAAVSLMGIVSAPLGAITMDLNAAATDFQATGGRLPYLWAASFGGALTGKLGWGAEFSGSATATRTDATRTNATRTDATRALGYLGYAARPRLVFDLGLSTSVTGRSATELFTGVTWNAGRLFGRPVDQRPRPAARTF